MKPLTLACLLGLFLAAPACRTQNPYPAAPGTLFIRQQICDLGDFKAGFFRPSNALKAHGFRAYRFYRDRHDPKTYLLAFTCANLQEAVGFLQNSNFTFSCVGAGLGLPLMWAGVPIQGSKDPNWDGYPDLKGFLVTRLDVGDYESWKKGWDAEGERGTGIRLYRLESRPHVVIETQEVPDILKVTEPPLSGDATYRETWLGTYLEGGIF